MAHPLLRVTAMGRLLPLVLVVVSLAASEARADGVYFSESLGGTSIKDELGARMSGAFRLRIAGGVRRGSWAVEGWLGGDIATTERPNDDLVPGALLSYGLDAKYLQPVMDHVEIYLRGGLSHGEMSGELDGYGGRGLGVGAGVQLKGKVPAIGFLWWPLFFTGWGPKVTASVFVDDGFDFYRLHKGGDLRATPAIDAQLTHLTVGFAIGSDF